MHELNCIGDIVGQLEAEYRRCKADVSSFS